MIVSAELGQYIGLAIVFSLGVAIGWIFGHKQTQAEEIREMINAPREK